MNDALFAEIALEQIGITTLETRKRDELDFYSIAVWELHASLRSAYLAGYAAATRVARGEEPALPTERHTIRGNVWLGAGEAADFGSEPDIETVTTLPIPELDLLGKRWQEAHACAVLIPMAIRQRRIG
ncbi:hypothetical protein PRJ39_06240 [Lysobacter enzymogenes]|uniref:DUF6900 domain-containing protein n=1 Tax=Lysobacter enzymogenes TaxID=69 RepID=UPI003749A8F3